MKNMKTVEITISIPVGEKHSPQLILDLVAETLSERFEEIDSDSGDGDETVADMHGFGGNTITVSCGKIVNEICL